IGIDLGDSEGEAEPEEEPGYDTPVGQAGSGQTPADILRDMDPQAIATRVAAEVRDMVVKRLEYLVTAAVEEAVIREIQKLKKAAAER
ncbi:MAG: hypothetical protein KKA60_08215, partial [Proteobacteria bacterium]|nr:hypothetical protein [Pseudomonadota bacterium]